MYPFKLVRAAVVADAARRPVDLLHGQPAAAKILIVGPGRGRRLRAAVLLLAESQAALERTRDVFDDAFLLMDVDLGATWKIDPTIIRWRAI